MFETRDDAGRIHFVVELITTRTTEANVPIYSFRTFLLGVNDELLDAVPSSVPQAFRRSDGTLLFRVVGERG